MFFYVSVALRRASDRDRPSRIWSFFATGRATFTKLPTDQPVAPRFAKSTATSSPTIQAFSPHRLTESDVRLARTYPVTHVYGCELGKMMRSAWFHSKREYVAK